MAELAVVEIVVPDLCEDCPPITLHIPIVELAGHYVAEPGYVDLAVRAHVRQHVREAPTL